MVIVGNMSFHLVGAGDIDEVPAGFFSGVANVLTKGSWVSHEKQERFRHVQFTQIVHQTLADLGITDLLRISLDREVIYERRVAGGDPFQEAMTRLSERVAAGYEMDEHLAFDLVYRYEDEAMTYVIRLDFVRRHDQRHEPLTIRVVASPRELRRESDEKNEAYVVRARSAGVSVDTAEAHVAQLLARMRDALSEHLVGQSVRTDLRKKMIRANSAEDLYQFTQFPGMLYGYSAYNDLSYIWLMPEIRNQKRADHGHYDSGSSFTDGGSSYSGAHHSSHDGGGGWFDSASSSGWDSGFSGGGHGGGGGDSWGDGGGSDGGGGDGGGGDGGGGGD